MGGGGRAGVAPCEQVVVQGRAEAAEVQPPCGAAPQQCPYCVVVYKVSLFFSALCKVSLLCSASYAKVCYLVLYMHTVFVLRVTSVQCSCIRMSKRFIQCVVRGHLSPRLISKKIPN